jgi:hypothetical protein
LLARSTPEFTASSKLLVEEELISVIRVIDI